MLWHLFELFFSYILCDIYQRWPLNLFIVKEVLLSAGHSLYFTNKKNIDF